MFVESVLKGSIISLSIEVLLCQESGAICWGGTWCEPWSLSGYEGLGVNSVMNRPIVVTGH